MYWTQKRVQSNNILWYKTNLVVTRKKVKQLRGGGAGALTPLKLLMTLDKDQGNAVKALLGVRV